MATPFDVQTDPSLPLLCPAFTLDGLTVRAASAALEAEIASLCEDLRQRFTGMPISDVPGVQAVRTTYSRVGVDPTRHRPSSEALLHRVLKGQNLYRINTLVDALNFCSLRYMVPFGLYDAAALRPPVELRLGRDGEGYPGIRKEFVNVAGRYCLADTLGPFGNPSSDSDRAKITLATTRALVVAFLPKDTPAATAQDIVNGTAATLVKYSAP